MQHLSVGIDRGVADAADPKCATKDLGSGVGQITRTLEVADGVGEFSEAGLVGLVAPTVGNVDRHAGHSERRSVRGVGWPCPDQHPTQLASWSDRPVFDVIVRAGGDAVRNGACHSRTVVGMHGVA